MQPKIKEKRWKKEFESEIWEKWQRERIYSFDKESKKKVFSIDTPPPYVNNPVHMGHAYTYSQMDMIARYKRMKGFNVLFPIGLDKNGLPIEVQTEKQFKIKMTEVPREEFLKKCKELINMYGDISLEIFKRCGLSCNSWELKYEVGGRYDTDDPEYRRLTQETFIELWKRGLIYEDIKPTNYCYVCKTTIADAEIEYKEGETLLNYLRFKIDGEDRYIIVATTRPELLCTCKIILFNPNDKRYKDLEGKYAIVPIFGHKVKIISHPYAKMEFGSGLVMICSFGDYSDVRLLRELGIEPTYAIDLDGRMNKNAGDYRGLTVKEARKKIIEDLREKGYLEKQEKIIHREPICWRSKNPIEFIALKEFYLKQVEFVDEIKKISDRIKFFAPESKQILIDWINSISIDWPISRRRYYGTEIPLWYCKKCGEVILPEKGRYYQPWKEKCPVEKCPKCGGNEFRGEERTFDTWFDSSISEIYILGYLWDKEFFKANFPCSLRPQGKEIVRTWLYYTLLRAYQLFGLPAFENVWINKHIVDERGEKMSKSLGNVIDPRDVLDEFGAEGLRIWSVLEGDITKGDVRCSMKRIENHSKFLTKFWNIARFISIFPHVKEFDIGKLTKSDQLVLNELNKLIENVTDAFEEYSFFKAGREIRNFVWNFFADHYIEMVKMRAYNQDGKFSEDEQNSAIWTLHHCLKTILKLLAPICPFITEKIWLELYGEKSIHLERFPEVRKGKFDVSVKVEDLMDVNSKIWKFKKDNGLSLKDKISKVVLPKEFKEIEKDLKLMHNIERIEYGDELFIEE